MYTTPNYMFCFNVLKRVFYMGSVNFDELYGNEEATKNFLVKLLYITIKTFRTPVPPQYLEMPIRFEGDEAHKAITLELPDARSECDCNYVALRESKDGKLLFISSELYSFGNRFKLCVFSRSAHYSLVNEINCYQDFADAVLSLGDDYD